MLLNGLKTDIETNIKSFLVANVLYFGVGDSSTTPAVTDTALGNELLRQTIQEYDDSGVNVVTFSGFIGSSQLNTNTLREYGFFNASTGTPMYAHALNTAVTKIAAIELWYDTNIEYEVELNYT